MIASILSATLFGVDGHQVHVEVHVSNGLPGLTIVGLPDAACREARDRVRAALMSAGESTPQRRVTVNLAPSGLRKVGSGLDLAIAVGVLVATQKLPPLPRLGFVGELGLDGAIRQVHGIVPLVHAIDAPVVVVPAACAGQASLVSDKEVYGVESVAQLVSFLRGAQQWPAPAVATANVARTEPDIADVRGQRIARWAVEVAAAGGHNLLMTGPPGSGKTMLAERLPGLLPDLDRDCALAVTKIHSAAGLLGDDHGLMVRPPFRAPHHSASLVSLVGGGAPAMRPGEVSLAHGGVLFLDEMGEFPRSVLDALRQPLEEGVMRISRASGSVTYPARFLLVGATNPCPCGEGLTPAACTCTEFERHRYQARLSGPLLDRFDLRINVGRPHIEQFFGGASSESSEVVAQRVLEARRFAQERNVRCNAELPAAALDRIAPLSAEAERVLSRQMRRGLLTARGLQRVRRVALTLADLEGGVTRISEQHICAALQLRPDEEPKELAS